MMSKKMSIRKLLCRRALPMTGVALAVVVLAALGMASLAAAESEAVTVVKTASPGQVPRGSLVLYTALFENTGASSVDLIIIRDTLPTAFRFLSMGGGSDIHDIPDGTTGTIVWNTGPYPVGAGADPAPGVQRLGRCSVERRSVLQPGAGRSVNRRDGL